MHIIKNRGGRGGLELETVSTVDSVITEMSIKYLTAEQSSYQLVRVLTESKGRKGISFSIKKKLGGRVRTNEVPELREVPSL